MLRNQNSQIVQFSVVTHFSVLFTLNTTHPRLIYILYVYDPRSHHHMCDVIKSGYSRSKFNIAKSPSEVYISVLQS